MSREENKPKRRQWAVGDFLENIDSFGEPLPVFNVKGRDTIQTRCGGLLTLAIILVVVLYGAVKLEHLLSKYNP